MDTTPITSFRGTAFSNFAIVPGGVTLDGVSYIAVEHAYQAAKTLDPKERESVRTQPTSALAKRAGRKVTIRDGWDEMKVGVMRKLLLQKFAPGTDFAAKLLATADRPLIEVNTWGDRFWGECPRGVGENHLGKLLMEIRKELRR